MSQSPPSTSSPAAGPVSGPAALADLLEALRSDLSGALPGRAAQMRMAPQARGAARFREEPGPEVRQGGVLVLLYPHRPESDALCLPLILRPTYSGVHSGQVGFPGGGREPSDADLTATALREGFEEVGADPERIQVLGMLSPLFVIASNYLVQPTVAWSPTRPEFHTDPYEVAALFETPLALLVDPATLRRETWDLRGTSLEVPFFSVAGQAVWGATAMILSELIALPSIRALAGLH